MILRKLAKSGPVPANTALAVIMPLMPWAYVVRNGRENVLRAAKGKLDQLRRARQVTITGGLVSVARVKNSHSLIQQGIKALNSTGQCDTSAIWSNKKTACWVIRQMKRLGWISQSDKWPVVTFIGKEPATLDAWQSHESTRRLQGAKQ